MPDKTFIAIVTEILDKRLVHIATSSGETLSNENGIDYLDAIAFLHGLVHKRKRNGGIVFVNYNSFKSNEYIFATASRSIKDKLFQSHRIRKEIDELEYEQELITEDYFRSAPGSQEFEQADFELYVNQLALHDLVEVDIDGYNLKLINGKSLTIRKAKKSITIYDIAGFFKPDSLYRSVKLFLDETQPLLIRSQFDALDFFDGITELDRLKNHAVFEANYVAKLAHVLNANLLSCNITLSRFHGASALSSYILAKSKARKEYHNYRYRRQLPPPMHKALMQSVFGGRAEQMKIGTIKDVYVYDINSAYAAAALLLPPMLTKPVMLFDWQPHPFSFWYCEYDFTKTDLYYGLLPNRELTNFTKFKLKGSGFFWQPEIQFIVDNYPECIKVSHGYAIETGAANFTNDIQKFYDLRLQLQAANDPTQRILKLALASLYGKFCQHNGKGYYYNLFYAAFITSHTRAALLKAVRGNERSVICFQTDAIHVDKPLPLDLTDKLGAYKLSRFDAVTYLDNGVYQCYRGGDPVKTKTRGFRHFDFAKCLSELKDKRSYTALVDFFVGHNLFSQNMFTGGSYLSEFRAIKTMRPAEKDYASMRIFEAADIDLTTDYLDSKPIAFYTGLPSALYHKSGSSDLQAALAMECARV